VRSSLCERYLILCRAALQGINEQQSIATKKLVAIQRDVNEESFTVLKNYCDKWGGLIAGVSVKKLNRCAAWGVASITRLFYRLTMRPCCLCVCVCVCARARRDLSALKSEVHSLGVNPAVLSLAADIVRMLHGARLTCCKV
jgi:hypothetical protein